MIRRLAATILLAATGVCALVASALLTSTASSAPGSNRVLAFTRTTGYRHASIEPAVAALERVATPLGVSIEVSQDVTRFSGEGLTRYGAVLLLSTTGEPLGPAGSATDALVRYVRGGGGLLAIHAATDAHAGDDRYVQLLGGLFDGHPGDVRVASCRTEGRHPAVTRLPTIFEVLDEYYLFRRFRPDNQVVVRCTAVDGVSTIPVAWYRQEGAGRVFYTCFGHTTETWTRGRLVEDHVMPALLWALGR